MGQGLPATQGDGWHHGAWLCDPRVSLLERCPSQVVLSAPQSQQGDVRWLPWRLPPSPPTPCSYNDVEDERRATNLLISADEAFADIQVSTVGVLNPLRGFSSFKFVPHTRDSVIVAIKSEENKGKIASCILLKFLSVNSSFHLNHVRAISLLVYYSVAYQILAKNQAF